MMLSSQYCDGALLGNLRRRTEPNTLSNPHNKKDRHMEQWLSNPMVQGGAAPFVVALLAALVLRPFGGGRYCGIALVLGFITTVYLAGQWQFTPLTSTRKIIVLGLIAMGVGLLLDVLPALRRYAPIPLVVAGAAAVLWVIWPVLGRRDGQDFFLLAGGATIYGALCVMAYTTLSERPRSAASAAIAAGAGTGGAALFGASALLGLFGLSLAAAAGALWLLATAGQLRRMGAVAMLPVGMLSAAIGVAAHVYAKVPWYSLAVLAVVPLLARIPLSTNTPPWLRGMIWVAVTMIAALVAVALTWNVAGAPLL